MPWRAIFFGVNFTASLAVALACVVTVEESVAGHGSRGAFVGGACLIWPALAFAIGEWCLYVWNVRFLERPLGFMYGAVGAFAIFALVANAVEAARYGNSQSGLFWAVFGASCLAIAAYTFLCCWHRMRRRPPAEPDFPTCPHCGYNLAHNTSGVCPECGEPIVDIATPDSAQHVRNR